MGCGKAQRDHQVLDLWSAATSINLNYAEGLMTLDENNRFVPSKQEVIDKIVELKRKMADVEVVE
jgi:hypothetical protein